MNITKNALLIAHVVAIISILMLANGYNDRTFSTVFALGASVATFALFWWLWAVSLYPAFFSPLRNLPTAGGASIFFGHTLRIISEPSGMPMREWVDTISNDGLIRYIFAHKEHVLLTDGGAMGEVLTRSSSIFQKPLYLRRGLGRIVGSGVLLAEGDEHREQRKALLPAFSHRTIRELYPIFLSKAKELVDCLTTSSQLQYTGSEIPTMGGQHYQHSEGQPAKAIELGGWCSRVTLDIIGIAGFGQDFGALRDPTNELYQIYSRLVQPGFIGKIFRMIEVFLPLSFLRKIPVKWNRDLDNATDTIRTSCRRIIDTKREQPHGEAPVIRNILGVAMGSTTFSDENLVDQMMT
jgi:cytochrome P450